MTRYERIKQFTIEEMAEYIRNECISSVTKGVVLDVDTIKEWLEGKIDE